MSDVFGVLPCLQQSRGIDQYDEPYMWKSFRKERDTWSMITSSLLSGYASPLGKQCSLINLHIVSDIAPLSQ
jgi:hypothetical protein